MTTYQGSCRCGQLRVDCVGEPVRVSVCHCLDCQRRSGSAFAKQVRWPDGDVSMAGHYKSWQRVADSGHVANYRFCPNCGSTVSYVIEGWPGLIAVPLGAFAGADALPDLPAPGFSVYEHRKHRWVEISGDQVKHSSSPSLDRAPGLGLE